MICPVCKGSGMTQVAHLRTLYTLPAKCGGCRGTGVVQEDLPDTRPLLDQMFDKKIEIQDEISELPDLPADLRRRWYARLDRIAVGQPEAEAQVRDLRTEVDEAEGDLPGVYLALIFTHLGDLAEMCADHQRRARK